MATHGTHDGSRVEAEEAGAHDAHGGHDAHDDHGAHGGHGADPNAGVLRGEAPTPAWLLTTAGITVLTVVLCVLLAIKIG